MKPFNIIKIMAVTFGVAAPAATGLLTLDLQAAPGDLDSLDLNIGGFIDSTGPATVNATAVQPDGKIIIGGNFSSVLGVPRVSVARLNADGTLDTGFNLNLDAGAVVNAVALQPDGKLLLGGGDVGRSQNIARYNVDGMFDSGFDPRPNGGVNCIAVQADGKVVFGGFFSTLRPNGAPTATTRNYVARVNADGTLDTTLDPNAEFYVNSVAVQTDGKVLLGGLFNTLQPDGAATATTRNHVARVNADGTLDTAFDPNPNDYVFSIAVQADGKVVLGGEFTSVQPDGAPTATARRFLARVNADGTLDSGFDPSPNGALNSIALLADGTMLLGGYFIDLQPNGAPFATTRRYVARINADGTLDTAFDPSANSTVHSIAVQADGRVLIGGEFTTLQPNGAPTAATRNFFARLLGYPAAQTILRTSLPHFETQFVWHRTGAMPELTHATFELSSDGGATFGLPIVATRSGTSADWETTIGLSLANLCRARGYTGDGQGNASSSMIEQVLRFGTDQRTPIPGLFNTGVDSAGTPLGLNEADLHYTLVASSPVLGSPFADTAAGGFPIPPWMGDNTVSAWIAPVTIGLGSAPGDYFYQTTFDLTGRDLATASLTGLWAADDAGTDILLNGTSMGTSMGTSSPGFSSWTSFSITNGFVPGLNTLIFKVNNGGTSPNPSGLRVEVTGLATASFTGYIFVHGGSVTLSWISLPGVTYRLQWKATLSDPAWTDLPDDVVATGAVSSKTFSLGNAASGYYRVASLP
jgi:uncharacterized delta-60 repeat protein